MTTLSAYYMHSICKDKSMLFVADPRYLIGFTTCITYHFMTEMGASNSRDSCSVRSDIDPTVNNTITLLSKDQLFYNFLADTLNAGNICQATNDTGTETFSSRDCDKYINLRNHGGYKCTYDTQRFDSDIQLYRDCLHYRFLQSLGYDDIVCKHWTLVYMCSLFGFMKALLQEGGVSTASVKDSDTIVERENMFSDVECDRYFDMKSYIDPVCKDNSLLYVTPLEQYNDFTQCITYHFMTEMGARDSCSDDSVRSNLNTTVKNTITLLAKDRLFHNFMVDTLDAGNICQAMNDTGTLSPFYCKSYFYVVKTHHLGIRCAYNNSQRIDAGSELLYDFCFHYRLMKSLGADSVCKVSLIENCDWYYNMVQSLAPTCICVFGLVGNLLSLCTFGSGAVETPVAYQLLWLAGVDITFILTWWVVEVLPEILSYYNEEYALTRYQTSIVSVLTVCLRPLACVTRSCTVWLTVLIGLYRYLAVCEPYNNSTSHSTRHGHKYVILFIVLSFLYSIPYFCEYYIDYKYTGMRYVHRDYMLDTYGKHSHGFYAVLRTSLVSRELLHIIIFKSTCSSYSQLALSYITVCNCQHSDRVEKTKEKEE